MRCKGSGETHIWKIILPTRWGWGGYCCVFNRTKHDAYASPCAFIDYLDLRYQSSKPSIRYSSNQCWPLQENAELLIRTEPVLMLYWKYQHSLSFSETFYLFIHVQKGTYIRTYTIYICCWDVLDFEGTEWHESRLYHLYIAWILGYSDLYIILKVLLVINIWTGKGFPRIF